MSMLFESYPEMFGSQGYMRRQPTQYHSWKPLTPLTPLEPEIKSPQMSEEQLKARQKKIVTLDAIKASVFPLEQRIEENKHCIEGKEYLYLQDQLERCHIALDNIEVDGDNEVRKKRKSIAVLVSEVLNRLDAKAEKVSHEDQKDKVEVIDDCENLESNDGLESNGQEDDSLEDNCEYLESKKDNLYISPKKETTTEFKEQARSHYLNVEHEEQLLCNNRIRMQLFDNSVNLVVDVRDILNEDLKIRFEEKGLMVTGKRGDERVRMMKALPNDCMVDSAVSQLSADGFMVIKVPRRRHLHPFQMMRHPFWF